MRLHAMLGFAVVLVVTACAFCGVLDAGLTPLQRGVGGVAGLLGFWLLCCIWERGRGPPR